MTSYSPVIASTITMPSLPLRASATCWALPALAVTSTYARIISLLPRLKRSATVAWVHAVGHRDPAPRPACGEPLFLARGYQPTPCFCEWAGGPRHHPESAHRRAGRGHGGADLDPAHLAGAADRHIPRHDHGAPGRGPDHRCPWPTLARRAPPRRCAGNRMGDVVRGARARGRVADAEPSTPGRAVAQDGHVL